MPALLKKSGPGKEHTLAPIPNDDVRGSKAATPVFSKQEEQAWTSFTLELCAQRDCQPMAVCIEGPMRIEGRSVDNKTVERPKKDYFMQLLRVERMSNLEESFLLVYWRSKITFKARRVCSVLDYSEIIDIVADNHYGDAFHIRTSDQVLALKATTNRHMVEWIAELMTVKNWNPLKKDCQAAHYHVQEVTTNLATIPNSLVMFGMQAKLKEEIRFVHPVCLKTQNSFPLSSIDLIAFQPEKSMLWLELLDDCGRTSKVSMVCPLHWCEDICRAIRYHIKQAIGKEMTAEPSLELGSGGMKYFHKDIPPYEMTTAPPGERGSSTSHEPSSVTPLERSSAPFQYEAVNPKGLLSQKSSVIPLEESDYAHISLVSPVPMPSARAHASKRDGTRTSDPSVDEVETSNNESLFEGAVAINLSQFVEQEQSSSSDETDCSAGENTVDGDDDAFVCHSDAGEGTINDKKDPALVQDEMNGKRCSVADYETKSPFDTSRRPGALLIRRKTRNSHRDYVVFDINEADDNNVQNSGSVTPSSEVASLSSIAPDNTSGTNFDSNNFLAYHIPSPCGSSSSQLSSVFEQGSLNIGLMPEAHRCRSQSTSNLRHLGCPGNAYDIPKTSYSPWKDEKETRSEPKEHTSWPNEAVPVLKRSQSVNERHTKTLVPKAASPCIQLVAGSSAYQEQLCVTEKPASDTLTKRKMTDFFRRKKFFKPSGQSLDIDHQQSAIPQNIPRSSSLTPVSNLSPATIMTRGLKSTSESIDSDSDSRSMMNRMLVRPLPTPPSTRPATPVSPVWNKGESSITSANATVWQDKDNEHIGTASLPANVAVHLNSTSSVQPKLESPGGARPYEDIEIASPPKSTEVHLNSYEEVKPKQEAQGEAIGLGSGCNIPGTGHSPANGKTVPTIVLRHDYSEQRPAQEGQVGSLAIPKRVVTPGPSKPRRQCSPQLLLKHHSNMYDDVTSPISTSTEYDSPGQQCQEGNAEGPSFYSWYKTPIMPAKFCPLGERPTDESNLAPVHIAVNSLQPDTNSVRHMPNVGVAGELYDYYDVPRIRTEVLSALSTPEGDERRRKSVEILNNLINRPLSSLDYTQPTSQLSTDLSLDSFYDHPICPSLRKSAVHCRSTPNLKLKISPEAIVH